MPARFGGPPNAPPGLKVVSSSAVDVVADDRKVVVAATAVLVPRDDDLAVGLKRDGFGAVLSAADRRRDFTPSTEGQVQGEIRVVADDREIVVDAVGGVPGEQDLAIRLNRDPRPYIINGPDGGGDHARLCRGIGGRKKRTDAYEREESEQAKAAGNC